MNWFQYLLQANIYFILLYGLYFLLLRNETFFRLNRVYLLGSAILAFLIPALQIEWIRSWFITEQVRQTTNSLKVIIYESAPVISGAGPSTSGSWSIFNWVTFIYLTGAGIFFCRFIWKLVALYMKQAPKSRAQSFFTKITISDDLEGRDTILEHEKVHSYEWHSADVLFFEFVTIINWFNPVVYACRKAIKYIHEFIADEIAASTQPSKEEYSMLLVSNIFNVETQKLSNGFFGESLIKRRIIMLHKNKSNRSALLKYGLSIPLFVGMLIFSSATLSSERIGTYVGNLGKSKLANLVKDIIVAGKPIIADSAVTSSDLVKGAEIQKIIFPEYPEGADSLALKISDIPEITIPAHKDSVYLGERVEQNPTFPGGVEGWSKFLQHYNYPVEARQNHVSGKIYARFTVEKDGSLNDIVILRDAGFGTGEEAVRLLRTSPKWKPATINGEPVRTSFTQPISLAIQDQGTDDKLISINKQSGDQLTVRPQKTNAVYIVDGKKTSLEDIKQLNPSLIKQVSVRVDRELAAKYGVDDGDRIIEITKKPAAFGWKAKISSLFFRNPISSKE